MQNFKIFGQIGALFLGIATMIGRCFVAGGDDLVRIGARGFDDVAVVGDDVLRFSDDALRLSDDVYRTGFKASDETFNLWNDVFLEVAQNGTELLLEEDLWEEDEEEEESIIAQFNLSSVNAMIFMKGRFQIYQLNKLSKTGFLRLMANAKPIEKPENARGNMVILKGKPNIWAIFGDKWIGIKHFQQGDYQYFELPVDLIHSTGNVESPVE